MATGRTFRIFLSSTFSDMKAERNALQHEVWPKLATLCSRHGYRFQAIDLRWGVSEEAGRDQKTMDICLREIERCQSISPRPNFVVLLGQKYGWRPLPSSVPAEEFERLLAELIEPARTMALEWYRCDNNAVPSEYVLRPRISSKDDESWPGAERTLLAAFRSAIQRKGLSFTHPERFGASASEQEILRGVLAMEDAREHVSCVFRNIDGLQPDCDFVDLLPGGQPDKECADALDSLKAQLVDRLGADNCQTVHAGWSSEGLKVDHLGELCKVIEDRLRSVIEQEIERRSLVDQATQERSLHLEFAAERSRNFVGHAQTLATIQERLKPYLAPPMLIHGPSGSGKSALMGRLSHLLSAECPEALVVTRFVGATATASDGRGLLDGICGEIAQSLNRTHVFGTRSYNDLVQDFAELAADQAEAGGLCLLLDGADQLDPDDPATDLPWLPMIARGGFRIVVTVADGPALDRLRQHWPSDGLLELPQIEAEEAESLIDLWMAEYKRSLTPSQRAEILKGFAAERLPLHLRLAIEEARRWRSFDASPPLPTTVAALFRRTIEGLASESNHGNVLVSRSLSYIAASRHGVSEDEMLDLLSADDEVIEDFRMRSPKSPQADNLPYVVWARLAFDLAPYLGTRGVDGATLMYLFHRQLREVVEEDTLNGAHGVVRHRALAEHFDPNLVGAAQGPRESRMPAANRRIAEVPYHQTMGEMWQALVATLSDLTFIERVLGANTEGEGKPPAPSKVYNLIADYTRAEDALRATVSAVVSPAPANTHDTDAALLAALERAIGREANLLARHPSLTWQQMYNQLALESGPAQAIFLAEAEARTGSSGPAWIGLRERLAQSQALIATVEAHAGGVTACASSPDGLLVATGGSDGVKLWKAKSGEFIRSFRYDERDEFLAKLAQHDPISSRFERQDESDLQRFVEVGFNHGQRIAKCAFDSSGQILLAYLNTETIVAWSVRDGSLVWCYSAIETYLNRWMTWGEYNGYDGHDGSRRVSPRGIAIASDIVVATNGDAVRIFGTQSGEVLGLFKLRDDIDTTFFDDVELTFAVQTNPPLAIIAKGTRGGRTLLFDPVTRNSVTARPSERSGVRSCAVTNKWIVLASQDGFLSVWDSTTGDLLNRVSIQFSAPKLQVSPDGLHLIVVNQNLCDSYLLPSLEQNIRFLGPFSISADSRMVVARPTAWVGARGYLCLWDLNTGKVLDELSSDIGSEVAFIGKTKNVVSGDDYGKMRLWSPSFCGETLSKEERHLSQFGSAVNACQFSADGSILLTAGDYTPVVLWNNERTESRRRDLDKFGNPKGFSLSPDGKKIVNVNHVRGIESTRSRNIVTFNHTNSHNSVEIWDISDSIDPDVLRIKLENKGGHLTVAFNPVGNLVAIQDLFFDHHEIVDRYGDSGESVYRMRIVDIVSKTVSIDVTLRQAERGSSIRQDFSGWTGLAFSTCGRWLLTLCFGGFDVIRVKDGKRVGVAMNPSRETELICLAFGPMGDLVVAGDGLGSLWIWDWPLIDQKDTLSVDFKPSRRVEAGNSRVLGCAIAGDGSIVAAATADGMVSIWDARSGNRLGMLPAPEVSSLALHPREPILVFGTNTGQVHFADLHGLPCEPDDEPLQSPSVYCPALGTDSGLSTYVELGAQGAEARTYHENPNWTSGFRTSRRNAPLQEPEPNKHGPDSHVLLSTPSARPTSTPQGAVAAAQALLAVNDAAGAAALLAEAPPSYGRANARAVCALRLGQPRQAIDYLQPELLPNGAVIPHKVKPDAWIVTYATALALAGDPRGAERALGWVKDAGHPGATRLRVALDAWRQSLSWTEALSYRLRGKAPRPVTLDFAPGEI